MRSFQELIRLCQESQRSLPEEIIHQDSLETGQSEEKIRDALEQRLSILRDTVYHALHGQWQPQLLPNDVPRYRAVTSEPLCGSMIWKASEIALALGTCNASMGRIVAAPTAGSCGILPGMLLSWESSPHNGSARTLEGLIVAAAVGDITAERATLAGAEGGCQAECGTAAAMGAAALCWLEGGSPQACGHAVALSFKSILGLVCDPVAGLVEIPCVKRNAMLVALGITAASMALAGIESTIPVDEMIDAMGDVGRALPQSLRETARGGIAITPTGQRLTRELLAHRPAAGVTSDATEL